MTTEENKPVTPEVTPEVKVQLDTEAAKPADPPKPAVPAVAEEAVEYEPTGDTGLDMALKFVAGQGITADHPAMVAAQKGDFSILKAELASKGAKGWEQFVALGEDAFKRTSAANTAKAEAVKKVVQEVAGGAEQWAEVQKWASANATAEEKAEINALLDKGGLQAKAAAKYLVDMYSKAGNVVTEPKDPTEGASRGGKSAASNGPLSAKEYTQAVQQLNIQLRGRIDGSPEYEALQRRRAAYRG